MVLCIGVLLVFCLLLWCFTTAATRADMEDDKKNESVDYRESIIKETMHELQDYDNH